MTSLPAGFISAALMFEDVLMCLFMSKQTGFFTLWNPILNMLLSFFHVYLILFLNKANSCFHILTIVITVNAI